MSQRRNLLAAAALAILVFLAYAPALDGAFQFDDQTSILENEALRFPSPGAWWSYWPTRGLCYLSLGADYQLHGLNTRGYHITNVLLHLAAGLCVFALLRLLFEEEVGSYWIAIFGAAVFLLHPLQSQAVAYIVQRATSMYALFYLLCAYFYLRARRGESSPWRWWAASYLCALLALVSKEPALSLPLGLLLLEALAAGPPSLRWKMWLPFAPLILMPLLVSRLGGFAFGNATPTLTGETLLVSRSHFALTQLEVVARYLALAAFPAGQNLDHDIAWRTTFGAGEAFLLLLHALLLVGAWMLFRRGHRRAAVGIAWFYLCLLPESSVYPIADAMFEHRAYLSLFGLVLLLCAAIARAKRPRARGRVALALLLILLFGVATARRAALWADPLLLWEDALSKSPSKARPHMAVGWIASNRGELGKAQLHLSQAVRLDPDYGMAWNNLGLVAQRLGEWDEAERCYSQALRLHPDEAVLHLNRGMARRQLGRIAEAADDLRRAIELDPSQKRRWRPLLQEIEEALQP